MAAPSLSVELPWQNLAAQGQALSGLGGDPAAAAAQLGPLYAASYNSALGLNSSLFSGLQTGYDTLRSNTDQQYADITAGYDRLYGDVLGRISGTNETNLRDINSAYNRRAGDATQDLINRGLGNSTVMNSIQAGIEQDRRRALTDSRSQFSQLEAQYANQLGQAGLQNRTRGVETGANLGQAQLGMLERVQAPYPQADLYTRLAQMYGASAQAQQDRQRAEDAMRPGIGFAQAGGGFVGGGSSGFGPFRGPSSTFGMSGGGGGLAGSGQFFGGGLGYYGGGGGSYVPPASYGFSVGNYEAPSDPGGFYSDPLAMQALGGGGIGAAAWGGYGSPMQDSYYGDSSADYSYYDSGVGQFVDPFDGWL